MSKLAPVLMMVLFASFCVVTPVALAETPQQQKMKDCNAQAAGKIGDDRKAFMKQCLSAKPAMTPQQEKMKMCNKAASEKALKGDERKKFMSSCLKAAD